MKKLLLTLIILSQTLSVWAQSGKFAWCNQVGSTSYDVGNAVAVDMMDNVIVVSSFTDTADVLTGPSKLNVVSKGMKDILITKFDRSGALMWSRAFGSPLDDEPTAVFTDVSGNVYVSGYFSLIVDFNPGLGAGMLNSSGGKDIFLVKFDPFGLFQWAKKMGGNGIDEARGLSIDRFNNVFVTGTYWNTATFNTSPFVANLTSNGASDIFVARFDQSGNYIWSRSIGGDDLDTSTAIANDRFGNVYITGNFSGGGADFNPGFGDYKMSPDGASDAFILKLNSGGSFVWAKKIGGPLNEYANSIHVSDSDFLYISGHFSGRVDFNSGTADADTFFLEAQGSKDAFVVKMDLSGNFIWAKSLGTIATECISTSVKTDVRGNVVLSGHFYDSLYFDLDTSEYLLKSNGGSDVFIAKLDPAGNTMWAKSFGGTLNDSSKAMNINMASSIFTTGSFGGMVDFNPAFDTAELISNGNSDMYIHKLDYCNPSARLLDDTICSPLTIEGITYDKSGTYKQIVTGSGGCEEFLTLKLDVRNLDNRITVSGYVLTAVQTGVKYQWIGCKEKNEIPGATGRSYITLGNAQYAVTIYDGHCRDTSECYDMKAHPPLSIEEQSTFRELNVYPNPNKGSFTVECSDALLGAQANIYNLLGQKISSNTIINQQTNYTLNSGFYILEIAHGNKRITRKIIIE